MKTGVLLVPLLALTGASSAGPDDDGLAITHLRGTIYRIWEAGAPSVSFVASVGEDGILLADTGYLEYAPELNRRLDVLSPPATSAIPGGMRRSASSSAGATWQPLYLMSSFSRSTT